MSQEEIEVFDALLIASPQDAPVKENTCIQTDWLTFAVKSTLTSFDPVAGLASTQSSSCS